MAVGARGGCRGGGRAAVAAGGCAAMAVGEDDTLLATQLDEQRRYYEQELARVDASAAQALVDATTLPRAAARAIDAQRAAIADARRAIADAQRDLCALQARATRSPRRCLIRWRDITLWSRRI